MTIITIEVDSIKIDALRESGLGYLKIARQLGFRKSTIAKHSQNKFHRSHLPPKERHYNG